jgi:pyrimidine operon attenuation protein/uracil phosphoribosyltransferase
MTLNCQVTSDHHKTLEDVKAENAVLKEELAKLQKQLERLEQEHKEHVEVLEFQVKAHRDDWEAERSEKQQALQDKAVIERQVKALQRDVRSLKLKVLWVMFICLVASWLAWF